MKLFYISLVFILFGVSGIAQGTIDLSKLNEDTQSGCLSGNCTDGEGARFLNSGIASIELLSGTFAGQMFTGFGTSYKFQPYGSGKDIRVKAIKQGYFKSELLQDGGFYVIAMRSGDTLEEDHGQYNDTYYEGCKLTQGVRIYYPRQGCGTISKRRRIL